MNKTLAWGLGWQHSLPLASRCLLLAGIKDSIASSLRPEFLNLGTFEP